MNKGRFLSAMDISTNYPVAVVGSKIADSLFAGADPIGQILVINGVPFSVVGEVAARGQTFSGDNDMLVYISYDYALNLFSTRAFMTSYYITSTTESTVDTTLSKVSTYLGLRIAFQLALQGVQPVADLRYHGYPDEFIDLTAGRHCLYLLIGRWHRHHEHHVGHGP